MRTSILAALRSARLRLLPALVAAATAAACATTAPAPLETRLADRGYRLGEKVQRIQDYRVDGFNTLDDQHVILNTGPGERYLVSTSIRCNDLSTAESIGFTSTGSSLTPLDKLIVSDRPPASPDCPIAELRKLEKIDKNKP